MRTAMKQDKEVKFPALTEEDLTQKGIKKLISKFDREIGYTKAILDVADWMKANGILDQLTYEQHRDLLNLKYK